MAKQTRAPRQGKFNPSKTLKPACGKQSKLSVPTPNTRIQPNKGYTPPGS